jgi:hypothetical protein
MLMELAGVCSVLMLGSLDLLYIVRLRTHAPIYRCIVVDHSLEPTWKSLFGGIRCSARCWYNMPRCIACYE